MKKIIVAIDGWSSSGKSSMARALAGKVGYRYVDTGAMYRAVTLWAMRHGMIAADGEVAADRLSESMPLMHIDFRREASGRQTTLLDGEDVEREIRSLEVSAHVSPVAAIPGVRRALVAMQQAMGKEKGVVMDGRDIGTVVFPDAELKVFVDASAETRARRRYDELRAKGQEVSYDDVLRNVEERDRIDSTRADSPLRCAQGALRLDNSEMTPEEQDEWMLARFNEATGC